MKVTKPITNTTLLTPCTVSVTEIFRMEKKEKIFAAITTDISDTNNEIIKYFFLYFTN